MRPIEHKPIVYHLCNKTQTQGVRLRIGEPFLDPGPEEDRLAGIGIAHPFVERQYAAELVQILHVFKKRVRED